MARRPLEKEGINLDGGRRTTQLMRDSLGGRDQIMLTTPTPQPSKPYSRSPLLLIAYGALCSTFLNVFLGTGIIWIAGSAALAVFLGTAEVVIQMRRRRASA